MVEDAEATGRIKVSGGAGEVSLFFLAVSAMLLICYMISTVIRTGAHVFDFRCSILGIRYRYSIFSFDSR